MTVKISELAEKLDSSVEEIVSLIKELDFEYDQESFEVDQDLAELIEDELGTTKSNVDVLVDKVEDALEREVVKSQRKKTAGKDVKTNSRSEAAVLEQKKIGKLEVDESISVKELAEKTGINAAKIIGELMKNGIIANINQQLDFETASVIMSEFSVELKKSVSTGTTTDFIEQNLAAIIGEDDTADLQERPSIITVMGHVDHGKTKLLDSIRNANVVAGESGGITQHIGAYQVKKNGKLITFLDTPGHEAFTEMRSRGAKITDIAILVVSATEGVKPTTIEAINHAKDAGVPIIVAINKVDLPESNPDKVKAELSEYGLQPEEWGGDTVMVPVSALQGTGIDNLLDMVLLVSEVQNLKANPNRQAVGTVIETHLDPGMGPVATIIINTGTLNIGDTVVVGDAYGKIKTMQNHAGKKMATAPPATPVFISGLSKTPQTGDILQVMKDDKTAREHAVHVSAHRNTMRISSNSIMSDIVSKIRSGEMQVLKVILKTDTKGSFEAIRQSLEGVKHDEVMVKIIHSGIGNIKESDVAMAAASNAIILGFHVGVPQQVESSIERTGVIVKNYKIIYELIEDVRNILTGLLSPEIVVVDLGLAEVRQVFLQKKKEMILGLKLTNGILKKGSKLRVKRGGEVVGEGEVLTLQKIDKQVDQIKAENECGIKFKGNVIVEEGDALEAYEIEERSKSL
jgi:translation initiation factor IF-2